jgi:hypothetical protein
VGLEFHVFGVGRHGKGKKGARGTAVSDEGAASAAGAEEGSPVARDDGGPWSDTWWRRVLERSLKYKIFIVRWKMKGERFGFNVYICTPR